jgi:pimeloyl-ACP methyl ester carboxylesterase
MQHHTFGSLAGPILVYFHGAPGAPVEAEGFHACAQAQGVQVVCQDRFAVDKGTTGPDYYQLLASDIVALAKGRRVHVVGFSIGAFVALQVCHRIPDRVESLHLISAAAPLEAGNFLDHMAGKSVFRLAKKAPFLFLLLSSWQGLLARYFPNFLFRMLFASAVAGDALLCIDPAFRSWTTRLLTDCFCRNLSGYVRDVLAYVAPWQEALKDVSVNIHLWHGDQDNWSPIGMSECLRQQIAGPVDLHRLEGLSHYSSLYAAVPEICQQVAQTQVGEAE